MKDKLLTIWNNIFPKGKSKRMYVFGFVFIALAVFLFFSTGPIEITERVKVYYGSGRNDFNYQNIARINPTFVVFVILSVISTFIGVFLIVVAYKNSLVKNDGTKIIKVSNIDKEDSASMLEQKLNELKILRDKKVISEGEYQDLRRKLIENSLIF